MAIHACSCGLRELKENQTQRYSLHSSNPRVLHAILDYVRYCLHTSNAVLATTLVLSRGLLHGQKCRLDCY